MPALIFAFICEGIGKRYWINAERLFEQRSESGEFVLGSPPQRNAIEKALQESCLSGNLMLDRYMVGFELKSGAPLWIDNRDICKHACVITKNEVDKTAWFESIILQQMARGRASGLTFIDNKPDSKTLSHIILMLSFVKVRMI